jgi:hypothetical protein
VGGFVMAVVVVGGLWFVAVVVVRINDALAM